MEIKPQDLRVGNLVIANGLHEGKIMTVEGIDRQGTMSPESRVILFKEHHVGEFIKDIKGIELTPEWLERFGFNRMSCPEPAYRLNDLVIEKETSLSEEFQQWYWIYYIANGQAHRRTYTPFVHNLQNLYFSLTGEELAIDKTSPKN